jgi:predicted DNA-binding transcriptional regulator AlpA
MAGQPPDRRPMIAPRDLAAFLGIPPHTLDQWRSQGLGPARHRIGRHIRYAWADVEQWLRQQRHGGARSA